MKKICICGGGSLGHVIAGYLSANGKATVSILTNHPTAWQNKIEICVPDNGEMLIGNIACVSANPAEALLDAEIVLLCLPGFLIKDELIKINPDIFGDCYTVPKEIPLLRDLEEYSYILDACGKNKKFGLGLSIALGEREKALKTATDLQRKYRDQLVKGLEWIKREGSVNLSNIQYLYSEDKVLKSVMGTIASIGLSINLLDDSKPVLGLSRLHKDIKVSGRTTRQQVEKGVNLGKALQDSSNNFGGQGGGHDIAAGAMIPFDSKDNFLNLVNDMVEYQINND